MCSWLVRGVELFIARYEDRPTSNGIAPEENERGGEGGGREEEAQARVKAERERERGGDRNGRAIERKKSVYRSADRIG